MRSSQLFITTAMAVLACAFFLFFVVPSKEAPSRNKTIVSNMTHSTHSNEKEKTPSSIETLSSLMEFKGRNIPECCCTFCEIEEVNNNTVFPLLRKVVETPFFSHFKIDLWSSCELWDDLPFCEMKACGVCECDEPPVWSFEHVAEFPPTGPNPDCTSMADDNVVTTVDSKILDGWASGKNNNSPSFLMDKDDSDSSTAQVVDLLKNPEGYTGYTGPSAEKVWSAIHSKNCFQQPTGKGKLRMSKQLSGEVGTVDEKNDVYCFLPAEQRLYNRFISGLHSSISLHIAHSYCLQMETNKTAECQTWGLNDQVAFDRVLSKSDRVENLYVAFTLLLRAVIKAEAAITAAVPVSDPVLEESLSYWKKSLLPELLSLPKKAPSTFDEFSLLFDDEFRDSSEKKRSELQQRFRHLQSIMQCVGCTRCKLWGTLQTLGIGTALKVLFHGENDQTSIHLSRQEAVALVNTLERLSSSLVFAQEFRTRPQTMKLFNQTFSGASCSSG